MKRKSIIYILTSLFYLLPLFANFTPQAEAADKHVKRLAVPPSIAEPPWLEKRRQAQLATTAQFAVFHEFSFADQLEQSGITFRNRVVANSGKYHIPVHYDHGNAVCIADVDNDGRHDIYFVTQAGGNELWRNLGDGRFANITTPTIALDAVISVGASFADTDNDGDADLYVTTVRQGNVLFENDGKGNFKDISAASGLAHKGHSSGAVFFDYNRDGLLDLFLTNVGQYTKEETATAPLDPTTDQKGEEYTYHVGLKDAFSGHLKPERYERSLLFKNKGDNRFAEVSQEMGLLDSSWSGDASPIDANEDGWPDLYVISMQGHDRYYENVEGKRFVDKSREVFPKTAWGAMGIQVFDYDNDGKMDIYVTDMHSDMSVEVGPWDEKLKADMQYPEDFLRSGGQSIFGNAFYHNQGDGTFTEISDEIGAENYWPWGLSSGDLNADGWQDAFLASSMNYPYRYGVNSVLLNNQGKAFLDSEFILGVEPRRDGSTAYPWFALDCSGTDRNHKDCEGQDGRLLVYGSLGTRSSVIFDLDGDGDLDIVTNEFNSEPMVLLSNLSAQKTIHYLEVDLVGNKSNRSALGAVVKVIAGEQTYTKVHDGQSGYLSQSLYPLYFGLDDAEEVASIEVQWPSGEKQVLAGPLASNRRIRVEEP